MPTMMDNFVFIVKNPSAVFSNCMKLVNVCDVPADIQAHHDDLDCHRSLELGNGVHWPQKD